MGLFSRKRKEIPADEEVQMVMDEAEQLLGVKPKAALKKLDMLKGDAYPLVTFGGPYNERFTRLCLQGLGGGEPLPAVAAFPWKRWENYPTVGDLLTLAGELSEPVLYLFAEPTRRSPGPAVEIEGLHTLMSDEQLVMLVMGEMNTFFRRDLLLTIGPGADVDSEEVLQEIMDAARKSGFRSLTVIG